MSAADLQLQQLQQLLTVGDECKNLLDSFKNNGGRCSERVQALVSSISDLCTVLKERHAAVGTSTEAYAKHESCHSVLEACRVFIKKYLSLVEKTRTNPGSWLAPAKSFEQKNIPFLETQIHWQLKFRDATALTEILRQNSISVSSSLCDPPDDVVDTLSRASSSASQALPRRSTADIPEASSSTRHSIPRRDGPYPHRGSGASTESSGLSYRNSSTSSMSSYAPSWRSAEEYALEETSSRSRASVALPMASPDAHSICRIMIPRVFGTGTSLSRMPHINQHGNWWEIIFKDKNGKPVLNHSIFAPYSQTCIPYTEWGGWKEPRPFAAWIHDVDNSNKTIRQQIFIPKTMPGPIKIDGTPRYVFLDPRKAPNFEAEHLKNLFFEFHTAIYGKTLLDIFDIDIIKSARGQGHESSKQQLKFWIDHEGSSTTDSYITFFANNDPDRRHLQFPVSWFGNSSAEEKEVKLEFLTKSRMKSREKPEEKVKKAATFNSQTTRASSVFSMDSNTTYESMTTVSTSRSNSYNPSIAKHTVISGQAQQMDYLKIKFTTLAESIRFQGLVRNLQSGSNPLKSASSSASRKSSSATGKATSQSDSRSP